MTTPVSEVRRADLTAADLKVKVFADGADRESMLESYANPLVSGFTTNPTLMRRAGVSDYVGFAKEMLKEIPDRDISFEVFSDEFDDMERQAREIATWGENVYVKIPVSNTKGETSYDLVHRLSQEGVKVNVTAIFVLDQVRS
ncbi:MAG: transaldolase, partial [Gemmatimonadetes bacterium]|nr:transaldolase [Gemmatimonadota bacterium]